MALNADDYPNPADLLAAAAETFRSRNAEYGNNFVVAGDVLKALFPRGITLVTAEDHMRFHFLSLIITKLTRFTNAKLSHADSMRDMAVYAIMMEAILTPTPTKSADASL